MAIAPTYPGVYIEELPSPVHTIVGVATSITAFVGYTKLGIDGRAQSVLSFSDYERLYGGLAADSELSYALQHFFNNGGNQAYVVRVPHSGANAAQVVFGGLTFTALSSGSWANGQLLIDVDTNGVNQSLPSQSMIGTVQITNGSTAVVGTTTTFTTALKVGQWVRFASDNSATVYEVGAIADDTHLTLATAYTGVSAASSGFALLVTYDPTAFNVTVTDLFDGAAESFPNLSLDRNRGNYVANVINDPDNGSQLVKVAVVSPSPTAAPTMSGVVGAAITSDAVNIALGATQLAGTVALTNDSTAVVGSGTKFTSVLAVGRSVSFGTDTTAFQVSAVADDTHLTLTAVYTGATAASANVHLLGPATQDYGVKVGVSSPTVAPPPFPLEKVRIFSQGLPLPQTVAGLAAQLQRALNQELGSKLAGASVQCSVAAASGQQKIRVNALLPGIPDAVITFSAPSGTLSDASSVLGLSAPFSANVAHYALGTNHGTPNWGQQTSSAPGSDGSGLPGTSDLIGDPASFTGIFALDKVDLFNLLSIPDATRASPGNPNSPDPSVDPNAIYSVAVTYCANRRAFLLIDPPANVNTVSAAVDWKTSGLAVHDPNGAAFFPRMRLADPLNGFQLRTFAPSGVVAGVYARIDAARGIWKAPAGIETTLTGVQGLVYRLTDLENGELNPLGLNCSRLFPIYGPVMWGARTLVGADADASQWKYVPVRRLALFMEESLYRGTKWAVFEPNDEVLWASLRLNIGSFMHDLFRKGAFQGQRPADAYLVKCDKDTTTQSDIDNGIVNVLVGFAPLKPAEFVVIQIQQLAGQLQV
jgi:phage tail sheath protein FI